MIGINDKIEAQFRRDRLRKVVSAVAMAVVAIPVLLALSLPPMGPSSIVYGTVSRLAAVPEDDGDKLFLLVELADGSTVRSSIPTTGQYRQGATVRLKKLEPLLFGRPVYQFSGYDENGA